MPEQTKEWKMVNALYNEAFDDLPSGAQDFIKELYDNLDPYEPFLDQMQHDPRKPVVEQERWLYSLYAKHIELDEESAREIYDEYGD